MTKKVFPLFLSILVTGNWVLQKPTLSFASIISTNLQKSEELITEAQAISLAEEFIVKNGYTELPAIERKEITLELLDKLVAFELVMKLRHNSLQPKAYGVIKKRRGSLGWTIIFTRVPKSNFDPKNGRGVSMTLEGKNLFMEPKEFLLSSVDKKIEVENK